MSRQRSNSFPVKYLPEENAWVPDIPETIANSNQALDESKSDVRASKDKLDDKKVTSFSAMSQGPAMRSVSYGSPKPRPISIAASPTYESGSVNSNSSLTSNNTNPPTTASRPSSPEKVFSVSASKSYHHISFEETSRCAEYINEILSPHTDPDLDHLFKTHEPLPIVPGEECDDQLFNSCRDGLLLIKLINKTVPGTIDEKIVRKPARNGAQVAENVQTMLKGATQIGVKLSNIGSEDIMKGNRHLMLSLIWQIIKLGLLSKINVRNNPNLNNLLSETEQKDSSKITNESLLMKWVNFHLLAAGSTLKMSNFTTDLQNGEILSTLLFQLATHGAPNQDQFKQIYQKFKLEKNPQLRASLIMDLTHALEVKPLLSAADIIKGNKEHAVAFCAQLFSKYPNLEETLTKHASSLQLEVKESEDIKALRDQLKDQQAQKVEIEEKLRNCCTKYELQQKIITDKDEALDKSAQKLGQYEAEKQALQTGMKSLQDANTNLQNRIDNLENELKTVKKELETVRKERDMFADKTKKLEGSVNEAHRSRRDSVSNMNAQVNQLRNELDAEKRAKEERVSQLESEISSLLHSIESATKLAQVVGITPSNNTGDPLLNTKNVLEQLIKRISDTENQLKAKLSDNDELNTIVVPNLKKKVDLLEKKLGEKDKEYIMASSELSSLKSSIAELNAVNASLKKELEKSKEIETKWNKVNEGDLPQLKSKLIEYEMQIKTKDKELEYMHRINRQNIDKTDQEYKASMAEANEFLEKMQEVSEISRSIKGRMQEHRVKSKLEMKPRDIESKVLMHAEMLSNAVNRIENVCKTLY